MPGWLHAFQQSGKNFAQIAEQRDIDFDVFVDLGGIDLDMNLAGQWRELPGIARDAIIKAHAKSNQQV